MSTMQLVSRRQAAPAPEVFEVRDGHVVAVRGEAIEQHDGVSPYFRDARLEELAQMLDRLSRYDAQARVIVVSDSASKAQAVRLSREIRAERAGAVEFFKPIKQSIDAVKGV